jgi:tetratricopeptide (TPR) repeat protein
MTQTGNDKLRMTSDECSSCLFHSSFVIRHWPLLLALVVSICLLAPVLHGQTASVDTLIREALTAYQSGKMDVALGKLRQASQASPVNPQIRLYLGLFLYEQDRDSIEARHYMESVLDQFPENRDLQLRLLDSYLRARDEAKSEALVLRLRSGMAADSRFGFNVIYTLISHGRLESARKEVEWVSNNLQGEVLFIGGLIPPSNDSGWACPTMDTATTSARWNRCGK